VRTEAYAVDLEGDAGTIKAHVWQVEYSVKMPKDQIILDWPL